MAREHFSIRLDPETRLALEREAARRGQAKTALAETFVREGVRMAAHPGVVFRDGPAGRRAGLVRGPDVWEVITVWQAEGRDREATAANLDLSPGVIDVALGYYADYRAEVDAWIESNWQQSEEGEAAWRRRQALSTS